MSNQRVHASVSVCPSVCMCVYVAALGQEVCAPMMSIKYDYVCVITSGYRGKWLFDFYIIPFALNKAVLQVVKLLQAHHMFAYHCDDVKWSYI